MASTIKRRKRANGSVAYMAEVKIWREGKLVLTKAATFDREPAAKAWAKKKEKELAQPGAVEAAKRPAPSLVDLIDRYIATSKKEIGRTKAQVLEAIKTHPIGVREPRDLRPSDLVDYAAWLGQERKPQTVQNYLSHLASVLRVARTAFDVEVHRDLVADAMDSAKRLGLVRKSEERRRRPTMDELDRLMQHFADRSRRRNALPMHRVMAFAIFSTRRQEEIARILWRDLEPATADHGARILVRDMKNPGEKKGNDVLVGLVPEAEAIIAATPRTAERIFPFSKDAEAAAGAISAAFTRACKVLGIEDLRFHDLRHEGISRLFELGWTIPRVAEVSGHRSWQSLQRYSHLRQTGDRFAGWPWLEVVTKP